MNPSREELEARLTALLLGELPDAEAAALRQTIAQDAELARLHHRLHQAIALVRETVAAPETETAAVTDAPKLAAERREKLLTSFKAAHSKELRRPRWRGANWGKGKWQEFAALAAMVVGLLGVAAALMISSLRQSRLGLELGYGKAAAKTTTIAGGGGMAFAVVSKIEAELARPQPSEFNAALFAKNPTPNPDNGVRISDQFHALNSPPGTAPAKPDLMSGPSPQRVVNFEYAPSPQDATFTLDPVGGVRAVEERRAGGVGGGAGMAGRDGSRSVVARDEPALGRREDTIEIKNGSLGFALTTNARVEFNTVGKAFVPAQQDTWFGAVPQDGLAFGGLNSQQAPQSSLGSHLILGVGRAASGPESDANKPAQFKDANVLGVISHEAVGFNNIDARRGNILAGKPDTDSDGANRFYRMRINGSSTTDAKDTPAESDKFAESSKRESIGVTPATGALRFHAETDQSGSNSKRVSARALGEELKLAEQLFEEAKLLKSRVEIALPRGERGEANEKLQVATGPVVASEIQQHPLEAGRNPAGKLLELADRETAPAPAPNRQKELPQKLDSIRLSELRSNGLALGQVIEGIDIKVKESDPDKKGINTVVNAGEPEGIEGNRRGRPMPPAGAPVPQPEVSTAENSFSTFSLNVSDVSFKLAAASLEKGQMPDPATVRSEEFINAFDYRDPEPKGSAPIAFAWERARYPFAHDRDLIRFSVKTAASGRQPGRPLNLVLLLDNSGSMERADRVRILQECLRVLARQLQPQDRVSVVAFARTPRLWVDGLPGHQAAELPQRVGGLVPQGGTNLEDAMTLAYQTALRHYLAHGVNRVVLLTDGAANLGDVQPESLKKKVETHRQQGIALDCFGIGWDGYNDDLLEALSRNGDGRYGFVNTPEAATSEFAGQLAGALKVAASDVKVQVEFNPRRATAYRQIGYAKHQLKKEQFRDNTVDAAEIGAAEAGNALYVVQVNPAGEGPLGTVRVRFKIPGTSDYREHEWPVPYEGAARSLEQSSTVLRLAASASAFSEWLVSSPYAGEVTSDKLLGYLSGVPETCPADPRPKKLEWMIRQARSVAGK